MSSARLKGGDNGLIDYDYGPKLDIGSIGLHGELFPTIEFG
ncbi:MAG TPA: hypothetical protein PKV33_04255 [Methanothrix sp.]|nr:hypothetical protein [Methanothrix sp.]